jgi:MurNAc alpha-1-phosphate uridylyltransferase
MSPISPIRTAMILAAGLGTRMRLAEDAPPKPLTVIAGRTLLDRMLDRLKDAGIRRVVVNVHFKAALLEAHLAASTHGLEVVISDERDGLMETGGGVVQARSLLGDAPFTVCNADILWQETDNNLQNLLDVFDADKMDACLLLANRERCTGYDGRGDFHIAVNPDSPAGRLSRRDDIEKTATAPVVYAPFVYAGVQIVNPALLEGAPEGPFSFNVLWDKALAERRLYGVELSGTWMHVGTPEGLAAAEKRLAENRA